MLLKRLNNVEQNKLNSFSPELNSGLSGSNSQTTLSQQTLQNLNNITNMQNSYHMNAFATGDRSVFIKNLLGLPQTLSEIMQNAQNFDKPLVGGTLGLSTINQEALQNQKVLSEIFSEMNPTVADGIVLNESAISQTKNNTVALMFSGMISLPDISKIILQNSKQAVAALIISMASASKNGLDGKQIQETLSVINSCISMAEANSPEQTLKSLMMLYLPWLPLNEGVGFDLEITPPDGENESNNSKLTVLIQTKNFGNLKGEFILTTSNSVDVYIICSEKFPKATLQKSLMQEGASHAMDTNIDIESIQPKTDDLNDARETKVNLSATNEMNPYLLLMAHAFIRNAILIDNGVVEPDDASEAEN